MAGAGLLASSVVRPALAAVALCYLGLTLSYSLWWRQVPVADVLAVAGGFVLRALAGGAAADVGLSRWFLIVTSACALFLVLGKRYAEAINEVAHGATRRTLHRYSPGLLRRLIAGSALLGVLGYARWAFTRSVPGPWLELSLVPFALWLGRYATMLRGGGGEAPEELILHDRTLMALGGLWGILFVLGIYGAR